ncbi:MAG: bifunctional diguanylate cyclase/phosphodiesterase [Pseudomonadota bacterium]
MTGPTSSAEPTASDLAHPLPSEAFVRLAFEFSEPVALIDRRGQLRWSNAPFRAALGPEVDGVTLETALASRRPLDQTGLRKAVAQSQPSRIEVYLQREDKARTVDVALGALDTETGLRSVFLHDVTATRQTAEAIARAEARCDQQNLHDPLSGLFNRRGLLRQLSDAMRKAEETRSNIGLCLVDLDRFRMLNETRGYEVGDELLVECADRLRRLAEPGQILARIGGDLFALVATEVKDLDAFHAKAVRMRDALGHEVSLREGRWAMSVRLGLAFAAPEEIDPATLLIHAEAALADAKSTPGGDIGLFSPATGQRYADRSRLSEEIRAAVEQGEFVACFQPQVELASGRVAGFEALVRWKHPERGLLEPFYFLDIADQLGLESAIDAAMLEQALDGLVTMRAAGHTVPRVAINFSARTMREGDRVDYLLWALEQRDLAPKDVVVEVHESTLITDDDDPAVQTIDRLARSGVRVELDDFGTGYAALSNVARLNIQALKIDRSLVSLMLGHQASAAVVSVIIALAKQIGLLVIAEGIESADEADELARLGCHTGQGYWYSRPLPLEHALTWLERSRRSGARRMIG